MKTRQGKPVITTTRPWWLGRNLALAGLIASVGAICLVLAGLL
jgi:hypothetical protein